MKAFVFILANILIILATELSGSSFFDRGVIHAIALIFVAVSSVPLARNYYLADPIFKKFLTTGIFAFLLFSISHTFEYMLFSAHKAYGDYIFAIAINFYLASILLMIFGSEIFLRAYSGYRRSMTQIILIGFSIFLLVSFSLILIIRPEIISLKTESAAPYLYAAGAMVTSFLFLKRLLLLRRATNASFSGFFRYLRIMLIFVMISLSFYVFYELLEEKIKLPVYQIVYLSHFFFYIGLSIMFFAFEELLKIGGVVKDVREFLNKSNKNNK